jgi:hypothetical protein
MACVMTLALVADGRLTIGHVGDTRLYTITRDGLRKLTRDHSPVGEREDAGELSEVDAMRHPRRHEVFRDVGSVYRDKDEVEFVDVVEQPLGRDSAILICSDGLTDMLPVSTVAHLVRQHAGDPERVVEALVGAANDAGGRDNVTVVYAEMPRFADALGRTAEELTPTEPRSGISDAVEKPEAAGMTRTGEKGGSGVLGAVRSVVRSRVTWFFAGMLIGVVGAIALMFYVAETQVRGPQTLVVGTESTARFSRIMEAVGVARPGDLVRVEPGTYEENVLIGSGIDLAARVPDSVTIRRPAAADGATAALTITGALNARIVGIRIETPADRPADAAVRISGPTVALELIQIVGPFRQAFVLSPSSGMTLHGGRVAIHGSLVTVPDDGQATIVNSILARAGTAGDPPITVSPSARLDLRGNVFSGYGAEIVKGLADSRRREILDGNLIMPAERPRGDVPSAPRGRGGRGR